MSKGYSTAPQASHPKGVVRSSRMNLQMVQNILLIWLDSNIDESSTDCSDAITQLRHVVHTINTFTDRDQFVDFLTDIHDQTVCIIISDTLCEKLVPLIHTVFVLQTIFIFGTKQAHLEQWAKGWTKVKGVFTEISSVCAALKQTAHQCEQNSIPIGIVSTSGDVFNKNWDQLPPSFMYTQILKEVLLSIDFQQKHFMEFIHYCREIFVNNAAQLKYLDKLQKEYRDDMSIWWYTYECFLYPMLNRALRVMDVNIIIKIGFFICDLHRHIERLHKTQFGDHNAESTLTVYRGQGMLETDFEEMKRNRGGLIAFNNFLSTSRNREISLLLAESNQADPALVGILFVIIVDSSKSSTPFASVSGISHFEVEDEVLFSMHTVFRIGDITLISENDRLFQVELALTGDDDRDLRRLTERIREETFLDSEGWYRLGLVLLKMGQPEKAQQVYEILLEQTTEESEKTPIYHQLGCVKADLGEYKEAIKFYQKALEMSEKTLPPNHPDLASSYNNLSEVYSSMGDYPKALSSYEKALAIRQQSLPFNHPDLASSYNNIGSVYFKMGEYPKVLLSYEKALLIQQLSLPPNHPDLASSYNNIGSVYSSMGDYRKALSSYETALAMRQRSLPPNHPDLASSYNNMGLLYSSIDDFPKAFLSHEKALTVRQQSLPPNHPDLASSYNNIGAVYFNMGEYSKALSSYEKALAIQQQSLPLNHPDLASSYNNMGLVYSVMGDYPKALSSYEKALAIEQQLVPSNHPYLASFYNNIGSVYFKMGDYPKALSSYEKALAIRQQSFPPNHPNLASSHSNVGLVYSSMGDRPKALSSYEKALAIRQQSLPPNHRDLAASYSNIGSLYGQTGEYAKALSYIEKAHGIFKKTLPAHHPHLANSYYNIDLLCEKMGNHAQACSFYESAVDITHLSLAPNHPDLQKYRSSIERVKLRL